MWMEVWLCHLHINWLGNFPPLTLRLQTKSNMENSSCTLAAAAALLLGVFSHAAGALTNDAITESNSLFNFTTTATATTTAATTTATARTLKWTEALTVADESSNGASPTTTAAKTTLSTVRDTQLDTSKDREDTNNNKADEKEEEEEEKSELGRTTTLNHASLTV